MPQFSFSFEWHMLLFGATWWTRYIVVKDQGYAVANDLEQVPSICQQLGTNVVHSGFVLVLHPIPLVTITLAFPVKQISGVRQCL